MEKSVTHVTKVPRHVTQAPAAPYARVTRTAVDAHGRGVILAAVPLKCGGDSPSISNAIR
jgi:hypothetical protein